MDLRLRRLQNEYEEIVNAFKQSKRIKIYDTKGKPPDRYYILYDINSLIENNNKIVKSNPFKVEIILPVNYPLSAPFCRMLNPIFHPNIAPNKICIADSWESGESLVDIIIRIGEIISYQNYNIKSPLNGEAARWVINNYDILPIDNRDLKEGINYDSIGIADNIFNKEQKKDLYICESCGTKVEEIYNCKSNHKVCINCKLVCGICDNLICKKCGYAKCFICNLLICRDCSIICQKCKNIFCKTHFDFELNLCFNCKPIIVESKNRISYEEIENSQNIVAKYNSAFMFCIFCGQKIHSDSIFCSHCGKKV